MKIKHEKTFTGALLVTIQKGHNLPGVNKCTSCCSLYHCPFCISSFYKPSKKSKLQTHLQLHFTRAVVQDDYTIHRCGLGCKPKLHYHCVYCPSIIYRRGNFVTHLKGCKISNAPLLAAISSSIPGVPSLTDATSTTIPSVSPQTIILSTTIPESSPQEAASSISIPCVPTKIFATRSTIPNASAQTFATSTSIPDVLAQAPASTTSAFVLIDGKAGVHYSESWEPNGNTLFLPVIGTVLANVEKYDQVSFEQGSYCIGDTPTSEFRRKVQGQTIHCWRYNDCDRKLFIALSYLFTDNQVFQDVVSAINYRWVNKTI